jgi:chromosome segregation ATPase
MVREQGQGVLHEKLKELEEKIRMLLTEVSQSRQEKKDLTGRIKELESSMGGMADQVNREKAEKEQLTLELKRSGEEREEIRAKVEGMLAEVSRMESNFRELG